MKLRWPFWYGYVNVNHKVWEWGTHSYWDKRGGYITINSPKRQLTLGCSWWGDR